MFKVNDTVIHTGMGICTVSEITKMKVGNNPPRDFYVLKPIYENSGTKIFVPIDSNIPLRYPLDANKIKDILSEVGSAETLWVENDAIRKNKFSEIIKSNDHIKIIKLLCELHEKRIEKEKSGKKLHLLDEKILHEAERLIHGELAYSMQIEPENVAEYIINNLK